MVRIDNAFHDFSLLNESLLFEAYSLNDVYQKYYSDIDQNVFSQIVSADPTSGSDKMGKYSKWLLWLYQNNNLKLEDLYKATEYLTLFHKFKNKIENNDIGKYQSLPELYRTVQPFEGQKTHGEEVRDIKNGEAEKVYEDNTWLVVVPHTERAACYYGKGTKWCTAATEGDNMFDEYNKQGKLYVNINKTTNKKYQFHFETMQFMDEIDAQIEDPVISTIGLTEGLFNYYYQNYGARAVFGLNFNCGTKLYKDEFDLIQFTDFAFSDGKVDDSVTVVVKDKNCFCLDLSEFGDGKYYTPCGYAILGRYLPIGKKDMGTVEFFDLFECKFLFKDILGIKNVYSYDEINSSPYDLIKFSTTDYQTNILDLKTLDITPIGCYASTVESVKRLVYSPRDKDQYTDDIAYINKSVGGRSGIIAFFNIKTKSYLTDFVYDNIKLETMYYEGTGYMMVCGFKSKARDYQNADIVFYDGTIIPYTQFAQTSDSYFSKHFASQGE